jgi:hypothetical protein
MPCHVHHLKHAFYSRLETEVEEPAIEQATESGVHSMEVGSLGSVVVELVDHPDTAGKHRSIFYSLHFIKC